MRPPERLNLRWGDFEANARLAFRKLRDEREFFDVTVVAECGEQVEANKVVLAGGSSFFHKILKANPQPHPLIYLKGVGYKHLVYLMNFVYTGETSIVEDDINDFLDIAQDLRVKGLTVHGTLETTGNQSTSRDSLPNQEAAKEPRPSPRASHHHTHCVTSTPPVPQDQVAAEEPGPSLALLRQSRPQSVTSTCPAPHHSVKYSLSHGQVAAKETSPSISNPHSVKSAFPQGQVAAIETVLSPSTSNPHRMKYALPQTKMAANESAPSSSTLNPQILKSALFRAQLDANEIALSPSILNPHISKSAHQCQVVAEHVRSFRIPRPRSMKSALLQDQAAEKQHAQSCRIPRPLSAKPAPHQIQVAAGGAKSLGMPRPHSDNSSHLNNALKRASCEEDHDNTCHFKVEVGDAEHYNIAYGVNDRGEAYIRHVSLRGREENWRNINVDEDIEGIVLSAEQEENYQVLSTGKEPKEEIMESSNDMAIREAADVVFEDEEMPHDWYEQGEESENMILGRNKDDKNNTIPDGVQDLADKTKSSEDTNFQCFLCSITFTTSSQLRRHKKSHMDEKQFPRQTRSKMSSQMGSSNEQKRINAEGEQLKRNDTGDKHYQCFLSSKKNSLMKKMINLNRQKMTHSENSYQCVQCPKSFSKLGNLKRHKMIHTGEKPYQCALCPKSFSLQANLKRHMMTHTQEKPYQCALCSKSFSTLYNLKQHKMTHTQEKPYQCVQCPKSFSQLGNLKRHEMIHTGEKLY